MIEINSTIFWQFANFLALLLILNVVLYRPLRNTIKERAETIDGARERARKLEVDIQEKMARYQEQLEEAKREAGKERAEMRAEASRKENEILGEAREKTADYVQKIRSQVSADAEQAGKKLEDDARTMAEMVATKVLGRKL
ncbi:MAG: ATP synthase F0 subunit B [Desulfuromonadales bacterium]